MIIKRNDWFFSACVAFCYLLLVGLIEFGIRGQLVWFYPYLSLSLFTFAVYGKDKYAAANGKWRTPEMWLHLMSLAGGWPGAILGRSWLRHKTKKQPFTSVFWLTVVVNVCFFIVFLLPQS